MALTPQEIAELDAYFGNAKQGSSGVWAGVGKTIGLDPETTKDVAKAIPSKAAEGIARLPFWANDLVNSAAQGITRLGGAAYEGLGGELSVEQAKALTNFKPVYGSDELAIEPLKEAGVPFYEPKTPLGKAAGTIAELGTSVYGTVKAPQIVEGAVNATKRLARVNPEKVASFRQAGITPTLADVSDSNVVKTAQNLVGEVPFSAGIIDKARTQTFDDAEKLLKSVGLGEAKTPAQAGQVVREGLLSYKSKGQQVIGKLYDNFDKYVPATEKIQARPIGAAISEITARPTEGLQKLFQKSEGGRFTKTIIDDLSVNNGILPYNAIKNYRTLIGGKLKDSFLLKTEDEAVYSRLYGALTDTMREAAKAKGPQALKAFERANAVNAAFMQKMQTKIEPLLKKPEVEQLFNSVLTNSKIGAKSQSVMNSLDRESQNIVRGSLIKQMGDDVANEFSATKFATKFKGLEPEARNAMMTGLSATEKNKLTKAVDALLEVKGTAGKANNSRTAYTGIMAGLPAGAYFSPTTTGASLATANISARLMTKQKFINWLASAPKAMTKNPEAYLSRLSAVAAADVSLADDVDRFKRSVIEPTPLKAAPALTNDDIRLLDDYFKNEQPPAPTNDNVPVEPLIPSVGQQGALPDSIKQNEGLRHVAYVDTIGNRTVGYGFNMDSGVARKVWKKAGLQRDFDAVYDGQEALSDLDAEALGTASFNIALDDATSLYDNFPNLSEPRQKALLDLSYQLGKTRLKEFDKFNAAVRAGKWNEAVRQLLKTKYATQVPKRSREVARQLLRDA